MFAIIVKIQKKRKIEKEIINMPHFKLSKIGEAGEINSDMLKAYKRKYILFFNSECDHCQYELESIKRNIEKFTEATFLFVSGEPASVLKPFYDLQHFKEFPFYMASDPDFAVKNAFDVHSFPTTFIYDDKNQLLKKISGEAKIELLINAK